MSLPLIKVPEYNLNLSNDIKVRFRPFLVKEEKVLLLAIETRDEDEITKAFIDIVQSCVLSDVDVTKVPFYDFEWIWLNIRAKSVGENIELKLKCPDDESMIVDYTLKIEDIKPDLNKTINNKIEFEPNYGVIMKVPTIKDVGSKKGLVELSTGLIRDCIQTIYNGEEVFDRKDIEPKELEEFVENLTMSQFKKLSKFFEELPQIEHTIKYKNPKTNKEFEFEMKGAADFFQ